MCSVWLLRTHPYLAKTRLLVIGERLQAFDLIQALFVPRPKSKTSRKQPVTMKLTSPIYTSTKGQETSIACSIIQQKSGFNSKVCVGCIASCRTRMPTDRIKEIQQAQYGCLRGMPQNEFFFNKSGSCVQKILFSVQRSDC